MSYDSEMQAALIADGEKLLALTGEDHGPWALEAETCPKCDATSGDDWSQCATHYPCPMGGPHSLPGDINPAAEVAELREQLATALADSAHWKANHAEMVQRNAVLRERPDLPADRLPSIARYEAQLATARAALQRIERWEFPDTGQFWQNTDGTMSDRPMSYAACYGSNGTRDFIRSIARTALATQVQS